jgi:hypothetical protein
VPNRASHFVATLALASLLTMTGCSGGGGSSPESPSGTTAGTGSPTSSIAAGQAFAGDGISFRYPQGWSELTLSGTSASSGSQLWNETVGMDGVNFVSVSGYLINISITTNNIGEQKDNIGRQIAVLFTKAGGSLESGPTDESLAGLPGLGFTGTALNPSGQSVSSRLVLAFDRTTEYFVNCQYDSSGQSALLAGCDQIVNSFALG